MARLAIIDECAGEPITPKKRVRLNISSPVMIGVEMGRIYKMVRGGSLPVDHGSKLVHMLAVISRQYTESEIERRVTALEEGAK